jgi:hypothetical protein
MIPRRDCQEIDKWQSELMDGYKEKENPTGSCWWGEGKLS